MQANKPEQEVRTLPDKGTWRARAVFSQFSVASRQQEGLHRISRVCPNGGGGGEEVQIVESMASISRIATRLAICCALLASSTSIINCQDDSAATTTTSQQTVVSDVDNDLDNSIGGFSVEQQRQSWPQMGANQNTTGKLELEFLNRRTFKKIIVIVELAHLNSGILFAGTVLKRTLEQDDGSRRSNKRLTLSETKFSTAFV